MNRVAYHCMECGTALDDNDRPVIPDEPKEWPSTAVVLTKVAAGLFGLPVVVCVAAGIVDQTWEPLIFIALMFIGLAVMFAWAWGIASWIDR